MTNARAGALATNSCVCLAPEEITYRRLSPGVVGRQGHSSIVSAPCLRSRCKQKSSVFIIGWCNSVALSIRASQTPRAAYRAAKCVQKSKGFLVLSFISRHRPMTLSHGDWSGTCGSLSTHFVGKPNSPRAIITTSGFHINGADFCGKRSVLENFVHTAACNYIKY